MSGHRNGWDETTSPQWRFLLQNESQERKRHRRMEDEQIFVKRATKRQKIRKANQKQETETQLRSALKDVGNNKEVVLGE